MIPRVSKAFFIPADPLSPFLSFFVITNSGKSQKSQSSHAAAPACLWWWAEGGLEEGHGAGGTSGVVGVPFCWFWNGERVAKGSTELTWCCADVAVFGPCWDLSLVLDQAGPSPALGPAQPMMGRADPTALTRIWPRSSPSMEHLPPQLPCWSHQPGHGDSHGLLTPVRTQREKNNPCCASVETIEGGEALAQPHSHPWVATEV